MKEMPQNQYIPGVCNIGSAEIAKRKMGGWAGLVATVLLWAVFILCGTAPVWRLLLFLPALLSAVGFLQAANRFCVYFGFAALFNIRSAGERITVQHAESRAKDRRKAWRIIARAVLAQ